jgi:tripartite-type tricarboxylate transporter receptor subunit TctC
MPTSGRLTSDPDRHAGLKPTRIALRIETKSQRVAKLNAEVRAAMAKPEVIEKLSAEAIEPGNLNPDGFTQFIRDEIVRWMPVAQKVITTSLPAASK